jgi:hypothetical protein
MTRAKNIYSYYRERYVFLFTNISLALIMVSSGIVFWKFRISSDAIPLHYDIFFGIDRIGPWYAALTYPLIALFLVVVNTLFGYLLFTRDKYLSYYLCLMAMLSCLMTTLHLGALVAIVL